MNIVKTEIEGVLIIEPRLFRDSRGYFFESFSEREFGEKVAPILGHGVRFCQDNESMSSYGKHVAVELTEDNHRQFFIPKGFAHGFAVLSETAVFQYKCDNFYHPEADGGTLMIALVSIGSFQQDMPISSKKIRSMQC